MRVYWTSVDNPIRRWVYRNRSAVAVAWTVFAVALQVAVR